MAAHMYKFTKTHCTEHLKWVNFIAHKSYFRKAVVKLQNIVKRGCILIKQMIFVQKEIIDKISSQRFLECLRYETGT